MTNLYASVPYLTGHSQTGDSSIAWMSAAETYVDIKNSTDGSSLVHFLSESGVMEFFVFSSTQRYKV
jgi:alpha-glucosidase (family GH31 glycosyl hydrolase)